MKENTLFSIARYFLVSGVGAYILTIIFYFTPAYIISNSWLESLISIFIVLGTVLLLGVFIVLGYIYKQAERGKLSNE